MSRSPAKKDAAQLVDLLAEVFTKLPEDPESIVNAWFDFTLENGRVMRVSMRQLIPGAGDVPIVASSGTVQ